MLLLAAYNPVGMRNRSRWIRGDAAMSADPRRGAGVVAVGCALTVAACGGAAKPDASAGSAGSFLRFSECMRAHGVPGYPDPTFPPGGGIAISFGNVNPNSPAFQGAAKACGGI